MKINLFCAITILGISTLLTIEASAKEIVTHKQINNISYYPENSSPDSYRDERCKLDLYYPVREKNFATLIWLHGGGLEGGNKHIPPPFMKQQFAVAAVNYRLKPKVKAAIAIEDAAAATAWVLQNITEYGGDPKKVIISGYSAGGYLALMVAMAPQYLKPYGYSASDLAGIISLSGQAITHYAIRAENKIPSTKVVVDQYAPINYVNTPKLPPILLVTGDRELELAGRYEENAFFMRMLKLNGNKPQIYELPNCNHGKMLGASWNLVIDFVDGRIEELQ